MYLRTIGLISASALGDIQEAWHTSKVDHFNSMNKATYQQRYFHDDEYWSADEGPLLFYICGEGTCNPSEGFFGQMAQTLGAKQYWLEHRYYGYSYPVNNWNSTDAYQFLSSEQALEDLAVFIAEVKRATPPRKSGL